MVELNLEHLLNDISPEFPCGKNLEEDPVFLTLEEKSRFVEERQMGDLILPAEEPDWKTVYNLSLELLERTRDIQVAMYLTCSLLRTDGFNGLNQGLSLLNGWLTKHWDAVYPRQDPDDDYPILRVNTLSSLNDYTLIRGPINHTPLIQAVNGRFSWRDIEIAEGKILPAEGETPLKMAMIDAAFNDTNIETLQRLTLSVKQSLEQVQAIAAILIDKAGAVNAPDLSDTTGLLQGIFKFVSDKLQQRQLAATDNDIASDEIAITSGNTGAGITMNNRSGIHNRKDVVRAIDEICKYFDHYEPSSPVPFLLIRAKKLLTMNFMEILQDLTPEAVNQAEKICGAKNENEK